MATKLTTIKSKRKALFLDRDGVINVNHGYVFKKEDFTLVDGIIDLIRQANKLKYLVIIVTNQSGIGRGFYTEKQFQELTNWMLELFSQHNVYIDKIYYCPHHPTEAIGEYAKTCNCRKPSPGMALNAISDFNIDISKSIMVGDKVTDVEFAIKANIPKVFWLSLVHEAFIINYYTDCAITKIECLSEVTLN